MCIRDRDLTDPTYIPFWAGRIFLEEQIKLIKEKEAAVGSQKSSSSSSSSLVSNKQPQPETKLKCNDDQQCNICHEFPPNRHIYESHGGISGSGPFCICEDCILRIGGGRRKKTRKHKKTKRKKKRKVRGRRKTKKH